MSSWLAARYGLGWGTARVWVRVAHALEGLPRIAAAYAAGGLSWDQLRPLTTFASAETDARWAEEAPGRRPAWLWREARRHHRVRAREAEEARRTRYLRLDWDQERSVLWLEGMFPAEEGTALQAALHARAESIPPDPGAADPPGARLADALVDVATGGPDRVRFPPPGAAAPRRRSVPVPRMRAEAVAARPPPGPLGRWWGHQPGQPGAPVPRPPPPHPRGRVADQRASGAGAAVPRSGGTTTEDERGARPDLTSAGARTRRTGCGPATARGPGAPATRT